MNKRITQARIYILFKKGQQKKGTKYNIKGSIVLVFKLIQHYNV